MSVEPSVSDRDPDAPILIGHHHGWLGLPDLPAPTTPPFGREDAIHTVLPLARDPNVRLVTLTGLGGIGKTRLAIAVAQELGCSVDVADADSDGLPDTCKAEHGSDPGKPDSDGDGPSDGDEVDKHKSDPTKFDTDGDNLTDFDEVMEHRSSPTRVDSDGDDLQDGNEVNQYNTDPAKFDGDGDGFGDGYDLGGGTNPLDNDIDDDGLLDGDEVHGQGTSPKEADGDGLTDGEEILNRGTDPFVVDMDGDRMSDGLDIASGTSPIAYDTDVYGASDAFDESPLDPNDGSAYMFARCG